MLSVNRLCNVVIILRVSIITLKVRVSNSEFTELIVID